MPQQSKQRLGPKRKIALIYNAFEDTPSETRIDHGDMWHLHQSVRSLARALRKLGHKVYVVSLADDLSAFQRRLLRLAPDVIFNQYDDVVHGALYEMRVATLVRMMGFPLTGSPALGLGLSRYKYMCSTLLQGAGIPIPGNTRLLERIGDVDRHAWQFPVIVQASQEHAGVGLDRDSVVTNKAALRQKVRTIITTYRQPALVQRFLLGREFNVGIIGGKRPRVLPLAEVDFSRLPEEIPPIMSYAAKFMENSTEYRKIRVTCPARVEPELAARISSTAIRAFRAVGGWGYGRVDIRLDEHDVPHVLEVNCNPLLEDGVGLARSAKVAGIGFSQLLDMIVNTAFDNPPFDPNLPIHFPRGRRKTVAKKE